MSGMREKWRASLVYCSPSSWGMMERKETSSDSVIFSLFSRTRSRLPVESSENSRIQQDIQIVKQQIMITITVRRDWWWEEIFLLISSSSEKWKLELPLFFTLVAISVQLFNTSKHIFEHFNWYITDRELKKTLSTTSSHTQWHQKLFSFSPLFFIVYRVGNSFSRIFFPFLDLLPLFLSNVYGVSWFMWRT